MPSATGPVEHPPLGTQRRTPRVPTVGWLASSRSVPAPTVVLMISDVEVGATGPKGRGVFARRAFVEGEFIFRRRHTRVIVADELAALSHQDRMHLCELGFDRFAVLAPPGCYLNHSCDPNAMRHGVTVFAWRPIVAGDEVTIDYRLNAFEGDRWRCRCVSSGCNGWVVGSFFAMDSERQRLLLPHAPDFIRREHRRRSKRTTAD